MRENGAELHNNTRQLQDAETCLCWLCLLLPVGLWVNLLYLYVQALLCGNFWYKEYGLVLCSRHRPTVKVMGLFQQKALPLLERLNQLLEDKQAARFSPNTCHQLVSGTDLVPGTFRYLFFMALIMVVFCASLCGAIEAAGLTNGP